MSVAVAPLAGDDLQAALDDLARLRVEVFGAFPYLYDGDPANEAHYLRSYRDNPRALLVAARFGDRIVGAATGMPLVDHGDASQIDGPLPPHGQIYYCAESVLLSDFRGQGIGHRFFDLREAEARRRGFAYCLFCSVVREETHPARPAAYRPLDPFWRKRGYELLPDVSATFTWTDVGDTEPSAKTLKAWMRTL